MTDELASRLSGSVVVVGVGETRRGDDGVGPLVARLLAKSGVARVIDSGNSPELDTWRIRMLAPDNVVFVDAVDFCGSPGAVAFLRPGELRAAGFDTHRAPLKLTMQYLECELKCRCHLLAIQPRDIRDGAPMCEEVRSSAADVAEMLRKSMLADRC